ncbi:MAG: ABC transporter permease [Butyricicoccus sp.]|nr:ABC transporter permease [Butyricicoccus sp.]
MKNFSEVYACLRRKNRKNYLLLMGCCFFSVLLITAYVSMMRSPTVLTVLPEGGDSRKQVMMIFVLAVIGCAVFTAYASGLFFRSKSRETGIFLALGATKAQIRHLLFTDLAKASLSSCVAGTLLGMPLAWGIWQIFRLFVVDSEEMVLHFDTNAIGFALVFSAFVIVMLFGMGIRFIRRTNIIDIVNESRKSEPIHEVPCWYGRVGILLMVVGAFVGYELPTFFVRILHWYAPEGLSAVGYAPLFVGLYMILLHTVVNGWGKRKKRYQNLISTSMMKFQGRQTVRNMLVITVLLAGAYFGMFYAPMLGTSAMIGYAERPVDYAYHFRNDQQIPLEDEVRQMAQEEGVTLTSWVQAPVAVLGIDGDKQIETEGAMGVTWHTEYREVLMSNPVLSESAWNVLTGQSIDIAPGTVASVFDANGSSAAATSNQLSRVTNPVTGQQLQVTPQTEVLKSDLLFSYKVLDDTDYATIIQGLTEEWQETMVFFNVENCGDTYPFAKRLFHTIVDRSGPEVEVMDAYDPILHAQEGDAYAFAPENVAQFGETIDYDQRDSSSFRLYWKYMPEFRVLDQMEFIRTMAVFLMLFLFIAIVCFAAVIVIAYTRCMTIALTNRQVYEDLEHLGASRAYLRQSVRGQVNRVFFMPGLIGTLTIYALYAMILYFNGDPLGYTMEELVGMAACLILVLLCSGLLYLAYRQTLHKVWRTLQIG